MLFLNLIKFLISIHIVIIKRSLVIWISIYLAYLIIMSIKSLKITKFTGLDLMRCKYLYEYLRFSRAFKDRNYLMFDNHNYKFQIFLNENKEYK